LKKFIGILILFFILSIATGIALAAGDPNDKEGSKDPPLFNRMPGFHIYRYDEIEFDRFEFPVGPKKTQVVEGRHYFVIYYANDGIRQPSGLQVARNYTNAVKAIGGQEIYSYEDGGYQCVTLKATKGGAESWAYISAASNGMYEIHVVEKQAMNQDVVADAKSLAKSIKDSGKAAIYGIYFDTGKADIKPESEASLKEIVKLLQTDPKLKLYIVGHTDNVGGLDSNMKLAKDRAEAVLKALTGKYGIAAARLQSFGVGPLAPVASNQTEEGRAKNRRVELVAQ
jgi:OmpA-OmpF porin, OOP family